MRNLSAGLLWAISGAVQLQAQQIEGLFPGLSGGVYCFFTDTVNDQLYIGGDSPGTRDTLIASPGILRWDGTAHHAVGCGFDPGCVPTPGWNLVPKVNCIANWNGELYAGGEFTGANGNVLNYVARFDGTNWQALAGGMDGPVKSIRAYPDGLYAAGWYTYADTVLANGLARWDGTRWHRVYDLPDITPGQSLNYINDVALYNGTVYICGNFVGPPGSGRHGLAYYNGSEWAGIGNGFTGAYTKVLKLDVHDSLLYIAGAFADEGPYGNPQNPASGIVAYNGAQWIDLGSGTDGSNIPWITDLVWHRDTMYVCGPFDHIGGVDAGELAYWDGLRWCGLLPNTAYYGIGAVGFFNDTLHIGGGFSVIGQDTAYRVAKWTGGNDVEECGMAMGIGYERPLSGPSLLAVYPNPAADELNIRCGGTGPGVVTISDALGQEVMSIPFGNAPINIGELSGGVYILRLEGHNLPSRSAPFVKL